MCWEKRNIHNNIFTCLPLGVYLFWWCGFSLVTTCVIFSLPWKNTGFANQERCNTFFTYKPNCVQNGPI